VPAHIPGRHRVREDAHHLTEESKASGKRSGNGMVNTNCLNGTAGRTFSTRLNAPSFMRLPKQLGTRLWPCS
jgi:hypothetical protein